jgi:hypothetical protein
MAVNAEEIVRRYEKLDGERGNFKSQWQEIADYMIPRKASITTQGAPGAKRTSKIFDGTAIRSLRILANGLYGHMTSPSAPWFELTVKDARLKMLDPVKDWLRDTSQRMQNSINTSNFGMASHEVYTDLGAFGTGCLYADVGKDTLLNFQSVPLAEICIAEDYQGRVDTVYRLIKLTARQATQQFGDKCSGDIQKAEGEGKEPDKLFDIIHAVYPRNDGEQGKIDKKNKPIASVYIERNKKNLLLEEGYDRFPYLVPRWEKDSGEVFGRSPGMDALPDVKMLNQMKKDYLRAIQKMIDPPLLVSDENKMRSMKTSAGSIVYYRSGGEPPHSLETKGNYQIAVDYEARIQEAIREAFYADLFMLLAQKPQNQMTATEVMERVEEKLVLLGPTMGRLQAEFYNPMLSTVFDIMFKAGMIPQVPMQLQGAGLEIEYISKLALAMRKFETDAMMKTAQFIAPMVQVNPEVIDNFDFDRAARGGAERFGLPADWMNPMSKVKQIRKDRAQQKAEMQQKQDAMMQAELAQKALPGMTKAVDPNSILAKTAGQMGQGQTPDQGIPQGQMMQ